MNNSLWSRSKASNSNSLDHTLERFQEQLQKRLAEIQRHATGLDELRLERRQLKVKADRLADAIAELGTPRYCFLSWLLSKRKLPT